MRRALVVDDNLLLVRTLTDILRLAGWDVTPVDSGIAAVGEVRSGDFDVVLMDIKMPGVNGVDAFRAMRVIRPDLRVVLMSAYTAPELIAEAEREGVARVLSKPVNPAALLALLEEGHATRRPVLVIDTDAAFLRTLSDLLKAEGYTTVSAEDLGHATLLLAERHPVAVLLHLHLGGVSAREAIATVHQASPESTLIVYSGRADAGRELASTAPEGWVHAYLQKPFATARVSTVLRDLHVSD